MDLKKLVHRKKRVPEKPKSTLGRIWYFIWHEDSLASWLVNIILAFILIKFIVYPGLGMAFGTGFPIVAVVSGSMEHTGGFDEWWGSPAQCNKACTQKDWYYEHNITLTEFRSFPFKNGFNRGDIMVLFGTAPEKVKVGDVIVYKSGKPYPIIHRVVRIRNEEKIYFVTKGDHNPESINRPLDGLNEYAVSETQLLGKAVFKVPYLGYIKIWFVEWFVDYVWNPLASLFT